MLKAEVLGAMQAAIGEGRTERELQDFFKGQSHIGDTFQRKGITHFKLFYLYLFLNMAHLYSHLNPLSLFMFCFRVSSPWACSQWLPV